MTTDTTLIQQVDPRTLTASERNTRTDLGDLTELAASIAAVGVLEPLVVATTGDGHLTILAGHRRAAAAIEAGVQSVPVIFRDDLAGDVEQLTVILSENLHRAGLSDREVIDAVQQMLDLGESGASVARRTGLTKKRASKIARAARSSDEVRQAVQQHDLTLDQALVLDEFADNPEHIASLIEALESDWPGEFDSRAHRFRQEHEQAKVTAAALDELREQGVSAWAEDDPERPEVCTQMWNLYPPETENVHTEHEQCPHRAVLVGYDWHNNAPRLREACTEPETHPTWTQIQADRAERAEALTQAHSDEDDAEAKKAQRRRVIANNKAMDAANAHRLDWLTGLLKPKRPDLGKNPATLLARLYSVRGGQIGQSGFHADTELERIGWKHGTPTDRAHAATANGYLFALLAAAIEQTTNRETWRSTWDTERHTAWLDALTTLGYEPTAIEAAMISGNIDTYTDEG